MIFKIAFLAKTQLANVTLVLLEIFMDTFNVSSKMCMVESRIITQITFEGLLVFMNPFNMQCKCTFLTRSLLANFA